MTNALKSLPSEELARKYRRPASATASGNGSVRVRMVRPVVMRLTDRSIDDLARLIVEKVSGGGCRVASVG